MPATRRSSLLPVMTLIALFGAISFVCLPLFAGELPQQLSDEAFWRMVTEFSEPGGYFRSDNFVSNETMFQYVIGDLKKSTKSGGVYLGVGPDQNFTYIVALQPKMAFIFDIRRQNMLQHLMYKALIELSEDRAEFLSRLFSRKRPADIGPKSSAEELFNAFDQAGPDRQFFAENLQAVKTQLIEKHGFTLSREDQENIEYVLRAFYIGGPDLNYNGVGGANFGGRGRMPSYAELMVLTDGDGENRSYLGSEENYRILRDFEKRNLIVPVVGDFAGSKAIRAVGDYLKEHDASVTAFYLSNVEQYLFQQNDDWSRFYSNVAVLPVDSTGTFIRSVFNNMVFVAQPNGYNLRSNSVLSSIPGLLKAFSAGEIRAYNDVIQMSR